MPEPIKILFLNHSDSSGGAARAAYRLMCALREQGYDIKMLVRDKQTNDPDVLLCFDYERKGFFKLFEKLVWKIKNRIRKQKWKRYPNREPVFLNDLDSISLIRAIKSIDFDILHLHFVANRFLNLSELKKIDKPIVWTLHDCWAFTGICHYFYDCERYKTFCGNCPFLHSDNEKDLSYDVWQRKKKSYSDLNLNIVTPSRWLAEAAYQSALLFSFPITVIPNPIDINLFSPYSQTIACEKLKLNLDKRYILYSAINAINDKRKGFFQLIEAIQILKQKNYIQNIELIVMGADKPIEELHTFIPVRYLGVINSDKIMISIYNAIDILVVPSLTENFSNAILESLACGTPVVAFDIGGNADLIEHKQNGYLAKALNTQDLAQGIKWCLDNKTMKLSDYAVKKVNDTFSFEIVSSKYIKLYKELLNE